MLGKDRIRRQVRVAAALVMGLALLAGCGGSGPSTRSDDDQTSGRELTDDEKFQAAHFQACEIMCTMLTRCSQVSLKEHWDQLSEEDRRVADSIGPDDLARHSAECTGSCQSSDLSVRQVEAIRSCLTGMPAEEDPAAAQCEAYVGCLEGVQPASM